MHFTPEYVLSLSPVQVNSYCKALSKMLAAENGSVENRDENLESNFGSKSRVKDYSDVPRGISRGTKLSDEEAKKAVELKKLELEKKHGKDYKMTLKDLMSAGIFK